MNKARRKVLSRIIDDIEGMKKKLLPILKEYKNNCWEPLIAALEEAQQEEEEASENAKGDKADEYASNASELENAVEEMNSILEEVLNTTENDFDQIITMIDNARGTE